MAKTLYGKTLSFSVTNSRNYLILFILWPFLAFLTALTNYHQREAKRVVYFFLVYYGLCFVISSQGIDAYRYALFLKDNALLPFSEFFKVIGGLYSDTSLDIAEPLVSFIVSRFTSFYGIYFAIWAGIFGFFYLKSVNKLYDQYQKNPSWNGFIIYIFFIVILPITTINSVRMWTAAWIFFYGAYHVIIYREYRYLLLSLSSILVHFSFLSANIILLIYIFLGNRNYLYMPLAVASFILPSLIAPYFRSVSMKFGGGIQRRYEGYASLDYVIERQQSLKETAWFLNLSDNLVFYYLLFAIIFIQFKYGYLMKGKAERSIFSFLLLFLSFVNFGKVIPSFGSRFQILFLLFATLYIFLYYIKMPGNKISWLSLIGLFPLALYSAVEFRQGSDTINTLIFAPGLGLPLLLPGLSITELIFT